MEHSVLENLLMPGQNRCNMPQTPQNSEAVRKSNLNEMKAFCSIETEAMERGLKLKDFEQLMKEHEPANEGSWDFFDRNYVQVQMSKEALKHSMAQDLMLAPDIATKYDAKTDGLYLAVYYKNPPGRLMRNQWTYDMKTFPDLERFIPGADLGSEFLDIDDNKVGFIRQNDKLMLPSDNSVIKTQKLQIGNRMIGRSIVMKDNLNFGI